MAKLTIPLGAVGTKKRCVGQSPWGTRHYGHSYHEIFLMAKWIWKQYEGSRVYGRISLGTNTYDPKISS
jgi:hypothetical protein